jgi:Kef-type K+ transport system membrane component KefB
MTAYAAIAVILTASAFAGALAVRLRQPLLVAFLVVGLAAGPSALGLVAAHSEIDLLAQIGVTVLLFVVGLKLDLNVVRHIGPVALATGLGQLGFTIFFGYLICLALGMPHVKALYVAVALTFSSTIIIVKLLSDKREIDSLHGRIAMGFLIVQDVAVVIAMMFLGSLSIADEAASVAAVSLTIALKLTVAGLALFVLMRYVLTPLLHMLARSQELLIVFAVAWGAALAALGEHVGFSKEVGAFLAGFSLASTPFRESISTRLVTLRDFLLLFFFIDLGGRLDLSTLGAEIDSALVLAVFVLLGNPLIVMSIMGYMGYRKRTGFLAGLTVAQISEFSIVFVAMGITLGHVDVTALGLVTLVGLVTITLSTYLILYSHPIYARISPLLGIFERRKPYREMEVEQASGLSDSPAVIVFGAGRFGRRLIEQLRARNVGVLAVDFDPENVRALQEQGLPVRFGDAEDADFPQTLPLVHATWAVSTLPEEDAHLALIEALRAHGFKGRYAVALRSEMEEDALARLQADRIFRPFEDAADHVAEQVAAEMGVH